MNLRAFETAVCDLFDRPWVSSCAALLEEEMSGSGSHDLGHILRVLRNADRIRAGEEDNGNQVDWEALAAAALLHDVVDLPKDHPERHLASRKSGALARAHLAQAADFEEARLANIEHAICAHSFSAEIPAETLEARILVDADRLETLGALGIARVFYVGAEMGTAIVDMTDPFAKNRQLDDLSFTVDHFFSKLLELRERFHTDTGRQIADARHEYMKGFLSQLADELGEEL